MKKPARKERKGLPCPSRSDEAWRSEIRIDPATNCPSLRTPISKVQHESYLHQLLRDRDDRYRICVGLKPLTEFEADALYMWNLRGLRQDAKKERKPSRRRGK